MKETSLKIATVHSFYRSAVPSGENTAVELQAEALSMAGHEVTVVARYTDELIGDPAYSLKSALTVLTGSGPSPLNVIEDFNPDVVHVHNLFPNWSTSWLKHVSQPVVSTIHNFRPVCAAGTLLRDGQFCNLCPTSGSHHAVAKGCYQGSSLRSVPLAIASRRSRVHPVFENSQALLFLSPRSMKTYETFGIDFSARSYLVPNFVEDTWGGGAPSKDLSEDYWIYVGRLSAEKGITELLRAWPQHEVLKVVGSGPEEHEARALAAGKDVTFLGFQNRGAISELLANSNGLVFPSICQEQSATMAYLEALQSGTPVIALRDNAVADDVKIGGAGVVVDAPSDFAQAMEVVRQDTARFSRQARKRFESEYSSKTWLEKIEQIYLDLVT